MDDYSFYEEELIKIKESMNESCKKIFALWDEIGDYTREMKANNRSTIICSCVNVIDKHLNGVYEEEKKRRDGFLKDIKNKENNVNSLYKQMGESGDSIWIDNDGNDIRAHSSLRQRLAFISKRNEEAAIRYASRYQRINSQIKELEKLLSELGEPIDDSLKDPKIWLTEEKSRDLSNRIEQCSSLRTDRKNRIPELVSMITHFFETLGITSKNATNELDLFILSKQQELPPTLQVMTSLDNRIIELNELLNTRKEMVRQYCNEIESLWMMLETPDNQRKEFSARIKSDLTDSTLLCYQSYIKKLQKDLQFKLVTLIPSIRDEIHALKDYINFYSTVLQTVDFSILDLPESAFSLELLEDHQRLYEQLEQARIVLDPIVEKLKRKEEFLRSKPELEALLRDPSRLTDKRNSFKYLQRQKELEKRVRSIPIINNDLMMLISEYEAQYGEIVIDGKHYIDELKEEEIRAPRSTMSTIRSNTSYYR